MGHTSFQTHPYLEIVGVILSIVLCSSMFHSVSVYPIILHRIPPNIPLYIYIYIYIYIYMHSFIYLSMHLFIYLLRDPLPAKHLEEQAGTKTYDLWCRKGGGTGWQDIK